MEEQVARAIPPVVDTAADVYQGAQAAGDIARQNVSYGMREAQRMATRPAAWAIDRGARTVQAARDAFGWIAD